MLPFDSLYLNIDAINSTKFENFFLTRSVLLFYEQKKHSMSELIRYELVFFFGRTGGAQGYRELSEILGNGHNSLSKRMGAIVWSRMSLVY